MQLRSSMAVAVAQANSYSSNVTPTLATSMCHRYGPKKKKRRRSKIIIIIIITTTIMLKFTKYLLYLMFFSWHLTINSFNSVTLGCEYYYYLHFIDNETELPVNELD